MRVLHIITDLITGGAERALFNLLSGGLADEGKSAVLSLSDEGNFGKSIRALGIPVYTLNMMRSVPMPNDLINLRRIVHNFRPDLVQGWMYHGNLAALMARYLAQTDPALFWNIRQTLSTLKEEKLLTRQVIRANRLFSSKADGIIYNSHLSRERHEAFGFTSEKGRVIANGFDFEHLSPSAEKRRAMRDLLKYSSDQIVIGHVARFHPVKNHAGFLRSAVKVLEKNSNVHFLFAGRDVSLENPALSGIVPSCFLDRFRFLGEREDVFDLMQAMDIFCLSSSSEAFPNALAEAMCAALPCVTTDVGDCRDIVGNTGVTVLPGDTDALAKSMFSLLEKTPEQRHELGKHARERIKDRYHINRIVREYLEFHYQFEKLQ